MISDNIPPAHPHSNMAPSILKNQQEKDVTIHTIKNISVDFGQYDSVSLPQKRIKANQSDLTNGLHRAKETEEKEVFNALLNAVHEVGFKETPRVPDQKEQHAFLVKQVNVIERRHALRTKESALVQNERKKLDKLAGSHSFQRDYKQLVQLLTEIKQLVSKLPKDVGACNYTILLLMRKALSNSAYQLMKCDESEPLVKMIHGLCLASYAKPKLMSAFHEIGARLDKVLSEEKRKESVDIHDKMHESRQAGHRHGLIRDCFSLEYITGYFKQVIGALSSVKIIGSVCSFLGFKYDPHGTFRNNSGALYDEVLEIDGKKTTVKTVYSPSPTINDTVSPEARGMLQAMENRALMKEEDLKNDPYPYVIWNYTNLQDICSRNEGARSVNIMRLNEEFPFSFRGMCMTVDSPFYVAGIHGDDDNAIERMTQDATPLNREYANSQIQELQHDDNFTLAKRDSKKGGHYYFPVKNENEKTQWKEVCKNVVERAFKLTSKSTRPESMSEEKWNWYQKAAFRELVLLGLIKVRQEMAGVEASKNGGGVLATNACKENIDRGGKTNACLLWALGGSNEDVFSAFHGRALLSRFRLALADRITPLYALTTVIKQEEAKKFLTRF